MQTFTVINSGWLQGIQQYWNLNIAALVNFLCRVVLIFAIFLSTQNNVATWPNAKQGYLVSFPAHRLPLHLCYSPRINSYHDPSLRGVTTEAKLLLGWLCLRRKRAGAGAGAGGAWGRVFHTRLLRGPFHPDPSFPDFCASAGQRKR